LFFFGFSIVLSGCGREGPYAGALYPVKGQVLLADGQPLSGGSVQFIPARGGLPATGVIDSDGSFTLKSKSREGAAPGDYKVRIEPPAALLAKSKKGKAGPKLPFAAKYREYDGDTGLVVKINAAPTQLEAFRLDAK
jgi:hypothetical protein